MLPQSSGSSGRENSSLAAVFAALMSRTVATRQLYWQPVVLVTEINSDNYICGRDSYRILTAAVTTAVAFAAGILTAALTAGVVFVERY